MILSMALSSVSVYAGGQHGTDAVAPPEITLHEAVLMGDIKAIEQHIAAGSNIDSKDAYGSTAIIVAATFGATETAGMLIDAGADKNAVNFAGRPALDSVSAPFAEVKPIYDGIGESLAPLGMKLDYRRIENARPEIAMMLRSS